MNTPVDARAIAEGVPDPELPMLTLGDLGILRDVAVDGTRVRVAITPTYSGCPALRAMHQDVEHALRVAGFAEVDVRTQLSPAWSSDWITHAGRRKLAAAGVAPPNAAPQRHAAGPVPLTLNARRVVRCPQCGSTDSTQVAAFGPTACTALYRCGACAEPFEYLKEI